MGQPSCDIGLIGLAVMGQNLVLNMSDHGFRVAVFNRTVSKVDDFLAQEAKGTPIVGAHSINELIGALKKPRRVMLMVKAMPLIYKTGVDGQRRKVRPTLRRRRHAFGGSATSVASLAVSNNLLNFSQIRIRGHRHRRLCQRRVSW